MITADEPAELERLIADMATIGCTVSWSKTCIWIGGNTYPNRDILKKNGWKWSAKKKMWWMPYEQYTGHVPGKGDDGYIDLAGRLDYDLGY